MLHFRFGFILLSPTGAENLSSLLRGLRTLQGGADKCAHICLVLSKEAPLAKTAMLPAKRLVHRICLACDLCL